MRKHGGSLVDARFGRLSAWCELARAGMLSFGTSLTAMLLGFLAGSGADTTQRDS